jgi:hypothetical protein
MAQVSFDTHGRFACRTYTITASAHTMLLHACSCQHDACCIISSTRQWGPQRSHITAASVTVRRDYVLQQQQQQQQGLPERVVVSTGRSRQRDHVSSILRDSTSALLSNWSSPFASLASENSNGSSSTSSSKLEASGAAVSEWLQQVRNSSCY